MACVSRTQRTVTLSSTEADYVAMGEVVKDVLFIRGILKCIQPQVKRNCTIVYEDNEGANSLANNTLSSSSSKHIDVRHHLLRELVAKRKVRVLYVKSALTVCSVVTVRSNKPWSVSWR